LPPQPLPQPRFHYAAAAMPPPAFHFHDDADAEPFSPFAIFTLMPMFSSIAPAPRIFRAVMLIIGLRFSRYATAFRDDYPPAMAFISPIFAFFEAMPPLLFYFRRRRYFLSMPITPIFHAISLSTEPAIFRRFPPLLLSCFRFESSRCRRYFSACIFIDVCFR